MLDLGTLSARMTLDSSQYTIALNRAGIQSSQSMAEIKGIMLQTLGVAGVTGLFIKAGQAAMEFGAELTNVASIANDLNIDKIKQGILDLENVYGSATELTRAFYQTYSAGIRGTEEDLVKFTGQIASLSKTILSDQATTVQAVTRLMNAYGIEVKDAGEVMDTFFQIVKLGQTTGPELAGSLGQVVNSASIAKLSLNELGAAIATLTRTMPTAVAVTSLNQAILAFVQPTQEAIKVAREYGIELSATALQQKGFANAIKEINDKAGDNVEALALMFGNVRSFRAVASLASNQAEEFQDVLRQFETKGGSQLEAFGKATANLRTTWHNSMVAMEKAFIHLGDSLAPTVETIAHMIEGVSSMLRGLGEGEIQTGLLTASFVYLATKIKTVIANKMALTAVTKANTVATAQNTMAQTTNAEAILKAGIAQQALGMSMPFQISSIKKQQSALAGLTGGLEGASGATTLLLNAYIAFETGKFVFNLTKSFMENTEAGQRLTESLGNMIFKMQDLLGVYEDLIKESEDLDLKIVAEDADTVKRWAEELSKTDLSAEAGQIYDRYTEALKAGNERAIREAREEMAKLVRSTRESIKEASAEIPPYKMEIKDILDVGGVSKEVAERMANLTEAEWDEFKQIAQEQFGTDNLLRISPSDYAKIFNIGDFEKAYKSQEQEFKSMTERFGSELLQITTEGILKGQSEQMTQAKELDVVLRYRQKIYEDMKRLEEDRVFAVKSGMEKEIKAAEDAIAKRLKLYQQLDDRVKELQGEELTGGEIVGRQVQEAGGLANIRKKILAQEEGTAPGFEQKTIQQYTATLDQGQRQEFQNLIERFQAKGADKATAETNAVIVMQRNLEKQAKVDEANSRQMIDLLQQLNDLFKDGGTLVLTSP